MTPEEQIRQLTKEINQHNYNYYVLNQPTISDYDFDQLMSQLQTLELFYPQFADPNSPTQRVGSDLTQTFQAVEHKYPMLSLANTYNEQDVRDFYSRVSEGLGGEPFEICAEMKYDGLSISLTYVDGRLQKAVTRGDGVRGDDVTANVRTIRSIPLVLNEGTGYPREFEIRGEILMPWSSFDKLNQERAEREEPLFANPRNAASGTLKSQNSKVVAQRGLDAYLYYLLLDDMPADACHYEMLQQAATWGFKISQGMKKCQSVDDVLAFINYWDTERKNLPVATDGIVLKVNSVRQQKHLGYTAKSPRWAIAYKFKTERACTRLNEVTYQVGRTGAITPVANMDPVLLAGTIVKRASLHNADVISQLDLHLGDMVYVEKGGEIIPKVVGVDTIQRTEGMQKVEFIKTCPECGTPLVRFEGEAAHFCPNDTACPPQIKGRIEHFISRKAMNIDSLGPETVDDYYQRGLIHDVADLYLLTVQDICGANTGRIKSAQKVVDGVRKTLSVPFERVVFAIGIRFVGETTAKLIARHFKTMEALRHATLEELMSVDGVGQVIAESVIKYFANPINASIVDRLATYGVQMQLSAEQLSDRSDKLAGKSIVISGVFALHSRDEYKSMIENNGGKNVGSISKKTSFILAGDNMGPSKLEKAQSLGIPLVSEQEFLAMVEHEEKYACI